MQEYKHKSMGFSLFWGLLGVDKKPEKWVNRYVTYIGSRVKKANQTALLRVSLSLCLIHDTMPPARGFFYGQKRAIFKPITQNTVQKRGFEANLTSQIQYCATLRYSLI